MIEIKRLVVGSLQTNCYLVISNNVFTHSEALLIDPGAEGDRILDEIKKNKTELKYIINTHYHFDHTDANEIVRKKTKAKILIHESEKNFVNFSVDKFLKQDDEIKIGDIVLKVIHTPGHSKGSICLLEKSLPVIFTGDTLFEFGHGRTDLDGGSFSDIQQSLKNLSFFLKKGIKIYPGHGDPWVLN